MSDRTKSCPLGTRGMGKVYRELGERRFEHDPRRGEAACGTDVWNRTTVWNRRAERSLIRKPRELCVERDAPAEYVTNPATGDTVQEERPVSQVNEIPGVDTRSHQSTARVAAGAE